jgi:RNA polymerase sigma-70 factor (ECF subfamily)
MDPAATVGLIAAGMESPVTEIQDFDRVMHLYWPRVLRFVMASVRDRDIAENLTQECFWSAYRSRNAFRGESSLNTWLMRIAVNAVRKYLRNRRLQFWRQVQNSAVDPTTICDALPDRGVSPEARALMEEQVRAIWDATRCLSSRQRTVFLLRFMEEMSPGEIAESTGMTESAVHVHLFRAVRAVRKSIRSTP